MRAKSIKNLYERKHKSYTLSGIWAEVFGEPETNGAWLVWGAEKNGKTWFSLMLANYFSTLAKVLYISGEEGTGKDFTASCKRAGIEASNRKMKVTEYMTIDELELRLGKRRAPKIVLLDNLTIYNDELKYGRFKALMDKYPDTLFIFIAHEESGQPYTGVAKMCKRLAKVIIHVKGLAAQVSGRCPGGTINIDEEKAALYWGEKQQQNGN